MARVRVAAAQVACVPGDVPENVARHLAAIRAARERGVDLVVFPELSLTGYETKPDVARLARASDAPELQGLAEAADGMTAVVGFIEANGPARPYNACAVLTGGRVVHVHRKLNLPTYGGLVEGRHYRAGEAVALCPTPLGDAACLICADTWNPALPWLAALAGAQAMLVPIASARGAVAAEFDSRANWIVNLRHTAMTYGLPVVMANHCGQAGGLDFWGGSMILDAVGRVVVQGGASPGLVLAEIDPADGTRARAQLPTARDADPIRVRAALDRLLEPRETRLA